MNIDPRALRKEVQSTLANAVASISAPTPEQLAEAFGKAAEAFGKMASKYGLPLPKVLEFEYQGAKARLILEVPAPPAVIAAPDSPGEAPRPRAPRHQG